MMSLTVLAVGDVVGEAGLDFLNRRLRSLKKMYGVDFTVVNGENADGLGLKPAQADSIFAAGADVITMGNHTWNKQQIVPMIEDCDYLLRPANYTARAPGRGFGVFDGPRGLRIGVLNLIGRCEMDSNFDSPFAVADRVLKGADCDVVLVDFHATHTHVPTADAKVLPKGLGFVTDLGMTGPANSVLGMDPTQALDRFLGGLPQRIRAADGPRKLEGCLFEIDTEQKRCVSVRRIDVAE